MFIHAFYTPFISYPGDIGVSEKNLDRWDELLQRAADHVAGCRCIAGCPVCIGAQEAGIGMKQDVGSLLQELAGGQRHVL